MAAVISRVPHPALRALNFFRRRPSRMAGGTPRRANLLKSATELEGPLERLEERVSFKGLDLPGILTVAFSTHWARRNSSISRSLIRYRSALPFFTLKSGGWR